MDVLFLDIDGVLNHATEGEDTYWDRFGEKNLALDEQNVKNLKTLLFRFPELKIVWSTDWRYCDEPVWREKWKNPRLWLENRSWMSGRIIGKTPRKMSSEHFHDIKWWLDDHPETGNYAVLEDSYFPENWFGIEKHVIRCDGNAGLTEKDVKRAIKILEGEFE